MHGLVAEPLQEAGHLAPLGLPMDRCGVGGLFELAEATVLEVLDRRVKSGQLLGDDEILVAEAGHGGHHLAHPCAYLGQSGADLGWWRLLCEGGDGSGEIGA